MSAAVWEIMGKDRSIGAIEYGSHNVFFCREGGQSGGGGGFVAEGHGGGAVVADDLRLGHEIQSKQMAKGDQVVDQEAGGGEDKRRAARQHSDEHQLALDG